MPRLLQRASLLVVLGAAFACSLLVDTSEIDAGCGPSMKYCEEKCVGIDEPFYGCSPSDCRPCPGDHVVNDCIENSCVFVACVKGWGCENCSVNLFTDVNNCGSCGNVCGGEEPSCSAGDCRSPGDAGGAAGSGS